MKNVNAITWYRRRLTYLRYMIIENMMKNVTFFHGSRFHCPRFHNVFKTIQKLNCICWKILIVLIEYRKWCHDLNIADEIIGWTCTVFNCIMLHCSFWCGFYQLGYQYAAGWDLTKNESGIKQISYCTVLVLIKLTKFAVALRLRCGCCKLIFWHYFIIFC